MVMTPDPHLNMRADIKATLQSIDARIRAGGNWRGTARICRDLATKLEMLADMDDQQGARVRYQSAPQAPSSGAEWLGASRFDERPPSERRKARPFSTLRDKVRADPERAKRVAEHKRTIITELPRPELGPGE